MDILGNLIKESELSTQNVRELVDDYSLISHYLGNELELNCRYSSPLRERDEDPSFSIFYGYGKSNANKLYFKDQAANLKGDVYDFLLLYLGASSVNKLLSQINFDLQLGLAGQVQQGLKPTIIKAIPVIKERPKLQIVVQEPTQEFKDYWWKKYNITRQICNMYQARCVRAIQYKYADCTKVKSTPDLCIAYAIGKYYKIYKPLGEKTEKFRNDYPANYVEGLVQIDWSRSDKLIITKALKECMLLRQHWNLQGIAGKSETTMIPEHTMERVLGHFKEVFLWLDPDEAGQKSTAKYLELYPSLKPVVISKQIKEKDLTDIYEVHRLGKTTNLLQNLTIL